MCESTCWDTCAAAIVLRAKGPPHSGSDPPPGTQLTPPSISHPAEEAAAEAKTMGLGHLVGVTDWLSGRAIPPHSWEHDWCFPHTGELEETPGSGLLMRGFALRV